MNKNELYADVLEIARKHGCYLTNFDEWVDGTITVRFLPIDD